MTQSHGNTLWQEPANAGATPAVLPAYLVWSGPDVVPSLAGPEQIALIDVDGSGIFLSIDLTPAYLVASGMTFVISHTGPSDAIAVDDGSGGIAYSTDFTLTPVALPYYDTAGVGHLVRSTAPRLRAVQVRGNIQFYE